MFESVISAILSKYLGAFLHDFKSSDLHIGSNIQLENVALRKDALAGLGIPIEVKVGTVGKLHIQIPWLHIMSRAVVVTIEDLNVVAGAGLDIVPVEDAAAAFIAKMAAVQAIEERKNTPEEKSSGPGFGVRLGMKVVDNVQIIIKRVNVRFEDRSVGGEPTATGFTLDYLRAETTNENWSPMYAELDLEKNPVLYKVGELKGLSLYMDPIVNDQLPQQHNYLLAPLSAMLKVRIIKRDNFEIDKPRVEMSLVVDRVGFGLKEVQLRAGLKLAEFFTLAAACQRFRNSRPRTSPLVDPIAWWKWAAHCVSGDATENLRRRSWAYIMTRRRIRQQFIPLHKLRIKGDKLKGADLQLMEKFEKELPVDDIVYFRALANAEVKAEEKARKEASKSQGFFTRIFNTNKDEIKLGEAEKEAIYAEIGYGPEPDTDDPKRVKMRLSILLQNAALNLETTDTGKAILAAQWSDLALKLDARGDGIQLHTSIATMLVEDPQAEVPQFAAMASAPPGSRPPLLDVRVDTTGETTAGSTTITIASQPLNIIVSAPALARIAGFAAAAKPSGLRALEAQAMAQLDALRQATSKGFQDVLKTRKKLVVNANIAGPVILIPESFHSLGSRALVVRLGDVTIGSRAATESSRHTDQDLYDLFAIKLDGLSIMNAIATEDWSREAREQVGNRLIEDFGININLEQSAVMDPQKAKIRIRGDLPFLRVDAAMEKLKDAIAVADGWVSRFKIPTVVSAAPKIVELGPEVGETLDGAAELAEAAAAARKAEQVVDVLPSITTPELAATLLLDAQFVVGKVQVVASKNGDQMFEASIEGVSVQVLQKQFEMQLDASLAAISLRDLYTKNDAARDIIRGGDAQSGQLLLTCHIDKINADAPEFIRPAASDIPLTKIDIDVKPIIIAVRPQVVAAGAKFAMDLIADRKQSLDIPAATVQIEEPTDTDKIEGGARPVVAKLPMGTTIELLLNAKAEALRIELWQSNDIQLAYAEIAGAKAILNMRRYAMVADASLERIEVVSLLGREPAYIVSPRVKGSVLHVLFSSFDRAASDFGGHDASVVVRAGGLQACAQAEFLKGIIGYALSFPLASIIKSGAASAGSAAAGAVARSAKQTQKMLLDVDMLAPLIQVAGVDGSIAITVDLGQLIVKNKFEGETDIMTVKLTKMRLAIGAEDLLGGADIIVDLSRPLASKVEPLAIGITVPAIALACSQKQLILTAGTLGHLLGAVIPPKDVPMIEDPALKPPASPSATTSPSLAAQPAPTAVNEPSQPMQLTAVVEDLHAVLIDDAGVHVIEAALSGLDLKLDRNANDEMTITARMHALRVTDSQRLDLVSLVTTGEELVPLKADISQRKGQPMTIDVMMSRPRIIVGLSIVNEAQAFFLPVAAAFGKMMPQSTPTPPVTPDQPSVEINAPSAAPSMGMVLRAALQDAAIIVPTDPKDPDAGCFVLGLGCEAEVYQNTPVLQVTAAIRGLSLAAGVRSSSQSASRVLEPFDLRFGLDTHPPTDTKTSYRSIKVDMDAIHATFSYENYKLIMAIVDSLQAQMGIKKEAKAEDAITPVATTVDPVPPSPVSDKLIKEVVAQTISAPSPSNITVTDPQPSTDIVPLPSTPKLTEIPDEILIEWKGLNLVVMDDCGGRFTPLVSAELSSIRAEIVGAAAHARFVLGLAVDCYNDGAAAWEPLIEPWDAVVIMRRPPVGGISIEARAEKKLDICVTHACISTILTAVRVWSVDLERKGPPPPPFAPFMLHNDLGVPVHVTVPTFETDMDMPHASSEPVGNTNHTRATLRQQRVVTGTFVVPGFDPISDVRIDRVGFRTHVIKISEATRAKAPADAPTTCVVVIEVVVKEGVKHIYVRSRIQLFNHLTIPLELRLLSVAAGVEPVTIPMPPGATAHVPIQYARDGMIELRNPTTATSPFGSAISVSELKIGQKLYPTGPTKLAVVVHPGGFTDSDELVKGKSLEEGKLVSFDAAVDMHLRAPLILENWCHGNVEYELRDVEHSIAVKGSMTMGQKAEIISVDPAAPKLQIFLKTDTTLLSGGQSLDSEKVILKGGADKKDGELLLAVEGRLEHGSKTLALFTPYWIVNRSGVDLIARQSGEAPAPGQQNPDDLLDKALPFSHARFEAGGRSTQIAIPGGAWSKSFPIDNVGAIGAVDVPDQSGGELALGFTVALASGEFRRTKVVTIVSRHVIVNNLSRPIVIAQEEVDNAGILVGPGVQKVVNWSNAKAPKRLRCKLLDDGSQWSAPIGLQNALDGTIYLRGDQGVIAETVRLEVLPESAITYLLVGPEDPVYPTYRIINNSSSVIAVRQKDMPFSKEIAPHTTCDFAWDDPFKDRIVQVRLGSAVAYSGAVFRDVKLEKFGRYKPIKIRGEDNVVRMEVFAQGPTRTLKVVDTREIVVDSKKAFNPPTATNASESDDEFEHVEDEGIDELKIDAKLAGIGVSVVDGSKELVYLSIEDIKVDLRRSQIIDHLALSAQLLQVDNPASDAAYPVVLSASPVTIVPPPPFLQASIRRRRVDTLDFFPYVAVGLQAMDVKVDTSLILAVVDFVQRLPLPTPDLSDPVPAAPTPPQGGTKKIYAELITLHPIVVTVTFSLGTLFNTNTSNPALVLLRALGVTVGNLDNSVIQLPAVELEHPFYSRGALIARLLRKYRTALVTAVWKILGSVDILGDPVGLFTDLSTGFKELVYEPAQGIVAGPEDFAKGVGRGVKSLVAHTIHGVFGAAGKVTGAIGSGLARLSADDDYIADREASRRNAPRHVGHGLAQGGLSLAKGLFDGVTGIVTQPVKGVQKEGAIGFFKGLGRGLAGVVIKPATGVLDFGSKTLEGVKNTTTLGNAITVRRRAPRLFGKEGELIRFEHAQSEGTHLLGIALAEKPKKFRNDVYVWHIPVKNGYLLVSDMHLMFFKKPVDAQVSLKWYFTLYHIDKLEIKELKVFFTVSEAGKRTFQIGNEVHVTALIANDAAAILKNVSSAAQTARVNFLASGAKEKDDE